MTPCDVSHFDDRSRIVYDDGRTPHLNVWFAYWVCSVANLDDFLSGRLRWNSGFEIKEMSDWFNVAALQHDREDQSCDSGDADDVSASGEREIDGLRPLAPVQHYPLMTCSVMGAAAAMAGAPAICLAEPAGEAVPAMLRRAILAWRRPGVSAVAHAEHPFDSRLRRLLSAEPGRDKVMFVICGFGAPRGEYAAPRSRQRAWEEFGFLVSSRVPTLGELHPVASQNMPVSIPSLADLVPTRFWIRPKVIEPHRYLMLYLAEPLEPGSLRVFLIYWAAVGMRLGQVPKSKDVTALCNPWVVERALETVRRYVASGLIELGLCQSCHDRAGCCDAQVQPTIDRCVKPLSGTLDDALQSIATLLAGYAVSEDGTSLRVKLSTWGVCLTDKGWIYRHRLEPYVDAITEEALAWGEGLPVDLLGPA